MRRLVEDSSCHSHRAMEEWRKWIILSCTCNLIAPDSYTSLASDLIGLLVGSAVGLVAIQTIVNK